jgi:predicted nucleic acid-binding protein
VSLFADTSAFYATADSHDRWRTRAPGDLDAAWRIGEAFPDQDFSIVDRTSFAVMERLGIASVASFDDHFSIYRFGPRRERAFDVRR